MKYIYLTIAIFLAFNSNCQISEFIHVDQFGYYPTEDKVAVISNPQIGYNSNLSFTPSSNMELRNFDNDQMVFQGPASSWDNGNTHGQSGDKGWWFDFSSYTTPGTFYVFDPGSGQRSAAFEINTNPYEAVLHAAVKMFYYNRCNFNKATPYAEASWTDGDNFMNNLQDANCRHIDDPSNTALEKDLTGGWFDAGDYNKYVTFTRSVIHQLLASYTDNAAIFDDDWNIPESGNGLPDILDEVKWELDWLMKMTNADGSVHIKMGSQNYSENTSSPPSANTDPRFYGPTCTSASIAVASIFSHAATVFENETGMGAFASTLENRAVDCWNLWEAAYASASLETDCDDGSIVAGDADRTVDEQKSDAIAAAVYLYELTGDIKYENYLLGEYSQLEPIVNGFWSPYTPAKNEALLHYTSLSNANNTIKNTILTSATDAVNNNWNAFYAFSANDLYRGESPDWIYSWGSNLPKAGIAVLALTMRKYNVAPNQNIALYEKAYEQMHYFHGVNPMGMVHLSNMYSRGGDRCVNEIYHTWFYDGTDFDNALNSTYGPAPGFLTGGPNQNFSNANISPPYGQPILKSYLDFNDGFPESSWEISEPAIYYQASYINMLSYFVNTDVITSDKNIAVSNDCVEIFPNPTNNYFRITGLLPKYTIQVLDSAGSIHSTIVPQGSEAVIDVSTLPTGMYFVSVINNTNASICTQKIIKQD